MSENITGEIGNPRVQTSVEWTIANYFSMSQKADTYITSPTFHFANASWFLRLYPNGERKKQSVEWMGLYLGMQSSVTEMIAVRCNVGIKSWEGDIYDQACFTHFYDKTGKDIWGFCKFKQRSVLLNNQSKIAAGGTLTIFCNASKFRCVTDEACQTESVYGTSALSRDFRSLLYSERKSDVVIKVENTAFPAHKLVLGTRSTVFAAMFEYDMKENSSGVVNVADCDADVFRDFLSFIYTGKIEKLCLENVFQLCMLSDKYDLSDLKEMCVDFMKQNLCLDVVCEVMSIADKHNINDLQASAKELIINNMKTLIPTEQWISFMRDSPLLAAKLLMTVIPDNKY